MITADRSLPFIYAWHLKLAGIDVQYDAEYGVRDRRAKTDEEIESLAKAQSVTESVMQQVCQIVAKANATADGTLRHEGETLTSDRVRQHRRNRVPKTWISPWGMVRLSQPRQKLPIVITTEPDRYAHVFPW